MSVGSDKLRCSPLVEVGYDGDEIFRKTEEGKCPDQLLMVGRWECSLEVKVVEDYVLLVHVSVLNAEA